METPATQRREISAGYFTMKNLEQELFREAQNLAALHGVSLEAITISVSPTRKGYLAESLAGKHAYADTLAGAIELLANRVIHAETPHSD